MATDKILVKVAQNAELKVSEGQTIVKKIVLGTPVRSVQAASVGAGTLNGESGGYYLDYNNFVNVPNILDSGDVLALVETQDIENIVDSGSGVKILGAVKVTDHIIPDSDETIDLGSPSKKFRSLYLAAGTLYVGGLAIGDSGGELTLNDIDNDGNIIAGTQKIIATDIDSDAILAIVSPSIDSAINALIDAAPDQLNTLNELAAALNDDSDAFNTLLSNIQGKVDSSAVVNLIDSDYIEARGGVPKTSSDLTTTVAAQVVDTFSSSEFRTAKYLIQLEHDSDSKYHSSEIMLTHNGTSVFLTEYAEVRSDSSLGEFDASLSGGTVSLTFSPSYTNTSFKARRISVDA